jgi:hypothetical protein
MVFFFRIDRLAAMPPFALAPEVDNDVPALAPPG